MQKCLTHMSDKNKQFIYDSIMENCIEIATHKHGMKLVVIKMLKVLYRLLCYSEMS